MNRRKRMIRDMIIMGGVTKPYIPLDYYIDVTAGADTDDGLTASTPWASYLNLYKVRPADIVHVKVGVSWLTTPYDIASLVEWRDASDVAEAVDASVPSWTGKKGNAATQAVAGQQPVVKLDTITGKKVLRFVGASSQYLVTAETMPTVAATLVLVYISNNIVDTQQYTGGYKWVVAGYDGLSIAIGTGLPRFLRSRAAGGPSNIGTYKHNLYSRHIASVGVEAGVDSFVRWDGLEIESAASVGTLPALQTFSIGSKMDNVTPGDYATIDVKHWMLFNTQLTAEENALVEIYLARDFNLYLHPYLFWTGWEYGDIRELHYQQSDATTHYEQNGTLSVVSGIAGSTNAYVLNSTQYNNTGADDSAKINRQADFIDTVRIPLGGEAWFSCRAKWAVIPVPVAGQDVVFQTKSATPSNPLYVLYFKTGGGLGFYRNQAVAAEVANVAAIPVLANNTWYEFEMRYLWDDGVDGVVSMWINRVKIWEDTGVNTTDTDGGGSAISFWAGEYSGNSPTPMPSTMYIDDFAITKTQRWV